MLRLLKVMYESLKVYVTHCNSYSDFFDNCIGLKQCEFFSPLLLELFLLRPNNNSCVSLMYQYTFSCLLMIMVVMAESAENFQESLNRAYEYCEELGIEVNVETPKFVVFRKRGKVVR
jgi:hypothetical protein